MDDVLDKMLRSAGKFNVEKIRQEGVVWAGDEQVEASPKAEGGRSRNAGS